VNTQRRRRRVIAGLVAGALILMASPLVGMQPAAAADPLPPLANPIADGAVCDGAPETNPFNDLGGESAASRETILCLVAAELTNGTSATTFTPGGTVTRRQMALFIKRLADLLNELSTGKAALKSLPAYDGTSDYSDVAAGDPGAAAIGQLSQSQIVTGFPDGTFRPNSRVSRRQMAAFVNRLQFVLTGGTPYSTNKDFFTDDEGDPGEFNLNALAAVGIFQGDGAGRVNPGGILTRRQMANILLRDAQVYFGNGYIRSPFGPAGNASFAVTPTSTVTQEIAVEPATTDDRQYTVTGLLANTTYTIQLFPAANVHGTTTITFSESGATNTADEGSVAADVTIVNGTTLVGADDDATAQAVNGQITFTVDGSAVESIVPVVYRDADGDGNLDLNANDTPVAAEPFGVGGQVRYLPPEATLGASGFTVTSVTPERDAFVSGGRTYFFDTNDTYRYQGVAITRAQFDSILSPGDVGTANYNPDPAGVSIFDITTDDVDATAAPTVTVTNSSGPTVNDARITYTRVATNSPGVTYTLQRSTVDDGLDNSCGTLDDSAGPFATVPGATQAPGSGSGQFVFSDNNVPDGCYSYRIRATSPISSNTADSAGSAATSIPPPADTTDPTSVFASMTTKAGLAGTFDTGDVVKIVFNEAMAIPAIGSKVQLRDGVGDLTIAELIAGTNATFSLNVAPEVVNAVSRPTGTVLTITLTAAPASVFPGLTAGLQVPATVVDEAGITDTSGNAWNLGGSSDVLVE
jgi:hypothetical protein